MQWKKNKKFVFFLFLKHFEPWCRTQMVTVRPITFQPITFLPILPFHPNYISPNSRFAQTTLTSEFHLKKKSLQFYFEFIKNFSSIVWNVNWVKRKFGEMWLSELLPHLQDAGSANNLQLVKSCPAAKKNIMETIFF